MTSNDIIRHNYRVIEDSPNTLSRPTPTLRHDSTVVVLNGILDKVEQSTSMYLSLGCATNAESINEQDSWYQIFPQGLFIPKFDTKQPECKKVLVCVDTFNNICTTRYTTQDSQRLYGSLEWHFERIKNHCEGLIEDIGNESVTSNINAKTTEYGKFVSVEFTKMLESEPLMWTLDIHLVQGELPQMDNINHVFDITQNDIQKQRLKEFVKRIDKFKSSMIMNYLKFRSGQDRLIQTMPYFQKQIKNRRSMKRIDLTQNVPEQLQNSDSNNIIDIDNSHLFFDWCGYVSPHIGVLWQYS